MSRRKVINDCGAFREKAIESGVLFIGSDEVCKPGDVFVFDGDPVMVVREIPRHEALAEPWKGNPRFPLFYEVTMD